MTFTHPTLNTWAPGLGPDQDTIRKLQTHFSIRPDLVANARPLLGHEGKKDYPFLQKPFKEITREEWAYFFWSLGSDIVCHDWPLCREGFEYWMVRIDLFNEPNEYHFQRLIENVLNGLFLIYPKNFPEEIRQDILLTLGRVILQPLFWSQNRYQESPAKLACVPYMFSLVLLFNLKYRNANEIQPWVQSLCLIECPNWRSYLLIWFVGLIEVFEARAQDLDDLSEVEHLNLFFNFKTHTLLTDWLSQENLKMIKQAISENVTKEELQNWLQEFKIERGRNFTTLLEDLQDVPKLFLEYYHSVNDLS